MSEALSKRSVALPLVVLALLALGLWGFTHEQIGDTRHDLVKRRLSTAVDILRAPATEALLSADSRAAFLQHLRDWSAVTELRLTLIQNDGSVLADTEVATGMPNLADRPEVRSSHNQTHGSDFRRSVVTGKESLYVAASLERDGQRLGTIRAATNVSEVDVALSGIETTFGLLVCTCLVLGTLIGVLMARSTTRAQMHSIAETRAESKAA